MFFYLNVYEQMQMETTGNLIGLAVLTLSAQSFLNCALLLSDLVAVDCSSSVKLSNAVMGFGWVVAELIKVY